LRFSLISLTAFGQDVFLPPDFYVKGRNFANKIWNASRFIIGKATSHGVTSDPLREETGDYSIADRWILSLLNETIEKTTASLEQFRLNEALNRIYDFFWHSFCDWYLEIAKIDEEQPERFRDVTIPVLLHVLTRTLALLHPFMPFITERLWQQVAGCFRRESDCLAAGRWPAPGPLRDTRAVSWMTRALEAVSAVRDAKASYRIPNRMPVSCELVGDPLHPDLERIIKRMAGINRIEMRTSIPDGAPIVRDLAIGKLAISFEGTADIGREAARLRRERENLAVVLAGIDAKLGQESFLSKAPADIIQRERIRRQTIAEKIAALDERIATLNGKGAPDGSDH